MKPRTIRSIQDTFRCNHFRNVSHSPPKINISYIDREAIRSQLIDRRRGVVTCLLSQMRGKTSDGPIRYWVSRSLRLRNTQISYRLINMWTNLISVECIHPFNCSNHVREIYAIENPIHGDIPLMIMNTWFVLNSTVVFAVLNNHSC